MKEINLQKIKNAEIIVGIPSYNEADSINNVVEQADKGLQEYFKSQRAVIINADNNSPDRTKEVFLKTKTSFPKIYLSTPPGVRGKGNNLCNLFKKIKVLKAKAAMVVDADIKNISPQWIKCLLYPVLEGYQFVSPIYYRNEYDGSITNNICYPLIFGLLGINLRQPIGGEFGFSPKLVKHLLEQSWTKSIENYGIDIFITIEAIKLGCPICTADLGTKIHKLSTPKLGSMFNQVTKTIFMELNKNKKLWQKTVEETSLPTICRVKNPSSPQKLTIDYKPLKSKAVSEFSLNHELIKQYLSPPVYKKLQQKRLNINDDQWVKILYDMFYIYTISSSQEKEKIVTALRSLYFPRVVNFIKETGDKNYKESEHLIQEQAKKFYKNRNYLLKKYK